jgi:hypothetical protein
MKHFLEKIKIFISKKKCLSFSILALLILLFVIYEINEILFYDLPPSGKVVEYDLIGTWKFKSRKLFASSSIIVLKKDGSYEIHNPPIWLRKMCEFPTKIYGTKLCGEIIVGDWDLTRFSERSHPYVRLKGIKGLRFTVHGRYPPYQFWYYRAGPELSPLRCWQWYSNEPQCSHCSGDKYWLYEVKKPTSESDTFDYEKLEEEERESLRYTMMAMGILLMLICGGYGAIKLHHVADKKK